MCGYFQQKIKSSCNTYKDRSTLNECVNRMPFNIQKILEESDLLVNSILTAPYSAIKLNMIV